MKKTYIAPIAKEEKLRCKRIVCNVYAGSLDGIHPQQEIPNAPGDPYSDNPNTSAIFSNDRNGGSDDQGPWSSIW